MSQSKLDIRERIVVEVLDPSRNAEEILGSLDIYLDMLAILNLYDLLNGIEFVLHHHWFYQVLPSSDVAVKHFTLHVCY